MNLQNEQIAEELKSLVRQHHRLRGSCLNLTASENVSSQSMRMIVASDLMHRYSEYEENNIDKRYNKGSKYIIEIEKIADELARRLFDAKYAELRPISGHVAAMAVVAALTRQGGVVMELHDMHGGHGWHSFASNIGIVDYKPAFLPFDTNRWNINLEEASKQIRKLKPDLIILGASFYLFPHPVREVSEVADEVGASVLYDGAHVLGLIGGKAWPNPLKSGADALTGSTHKTIPGPQRGIILSERKKVANRVAEVLYPAFLANHHVMNSAALAYAMAEFLEFGEAYAKQVVINAKALGEALSSKGFDVIGEKYGFTECHQILVKTDKYLKGDEAAKALERANIVCSKMEIKKADGLRLGVSEVTRVGMKEGEMEDIAKLMKVTLVDGKDPRKVAKEVRELVDNFKDIQYSFDKGDPYEYFTTVRR